MKKRVKKDNKFRATEVGALLEAIKAEIKPILEDIPSIKAKLDSTFEQVGKNTETLALVGIQIKSLQEKVSGNTEETHLIKHILSNHSEEIKSIKDTLKEHSGLLNRILEELKSKADRKDFEPPEKKVAPLTG